MKYDGIMLFLCLPSYIIHPPLNALQPYRTTYKAQEPIAA